MRSCVQMTTSSNAAALFVASAAAACELQVGLPPTKTTMLPRHLDGHDALHLVFSCDASKTLGGDVEDPEHAMYADVHCAGIR